MSTHTAVPPRGLAGATLRAGVVGLGQIGGGVAVSLARSGRAPKVYDLRSDASDELSGVPAVVESPAVVAEHSDVLFVAVVDAEQARRVLFDADGVLAGAKSGLIVVLLSTVSIPVVHELARECANSGVALLDCGVTPGDQAAHNGMVAMVGGDEAIVQDAMPVLADFAKSVVHCGPLGAGMATKIARNVITYGTWRAVHEAATLAQAAGVDPHTLIDIAGDADPTGATAFLWLRNQLDPTDEIRAHEPMVRRLMDKDLAAAQELATNENVLVPLVDATRAAGAQTLKISVKETP